MFGTRRHTDIVRSSVVRMNDLRPFEGDLDANSTSSNQSLQAAATGKLIDIDPDSQPESEKPKSEPEKPEPKQQETEEKKTKKFWKKNKSSGTNKVV